MKLKGQLKSDQNIFKTNQSNKLMAKATIKSYSLSEMKDKYIGKAGTANRDE